VSKGLAPPGARERILLFVKAPRAGLVKTRLVPVLGLDGAKALYRAFGLDFLETLRQLGRPVTVCFHPREEIAAVQEWLGTGLSYVPQEGEDLGRRMEHAFRANFDAGEDRILAVGGDTPDLPATLLEEAFRVLGENDAVIVPALDGGYASIGFTRQGYCPEAFRGIGWGSPSVLEQTLAILAAQGTRVGRLDPWPDVDTHADLEALRVRLGQSGACPVVRALLGKGEDG
jgi:rSAM/selenodomain-associated transferase 1